MSQLLYSLVTARSCDSLAVNVSCLPYECACVRKGFHDLHLCRLFNVRSLRRLSQLGGCEAANQQGPHQRSKAQHQAKLLRMLPRHLSIRMLSCRGPTSARSSMRSVSIQSHLPTSVAWSHRLVCKAYASSTKGNDLRTGLHGSAIMSVTT